MNLSATTVFLLWLVAAAAFATTPPADQASPQPPPGESPLANTPLPVPRALALVGAPDFSYRTAVINEDTVWRGTVLVEGWLIIAPQATLTLQPGTTVRFKGNGSGSAGLLVQGRLQAYGTQQQPVLLTSLYAEPRAGDWQGVRFVASEKNNVLEHCRIEGAVSGLEAAFSTLTASALRVSDCLTGLLLQDTLATLTGGVLSRCDVGLSLGESELDLREAVFADNQAGLVASGSSLLISAGRFAGNRLNGLVADNCRLRLVQTDFARNGNGAVLTACEGVVSGCRLVEQSDTGLSIVRSRLRVDGCEVQGNRIGLKLADRKAIFWSNALYRNSGFDLVYAGSDELSLGGNWWGEGAAPRVDTPRPPAGSSGRVLLEPLLTRNPVAEP